MVSLDHADQAVGVDVLASPAFVALPLKQATRLHEVVVPTVLAGALEFAQGSRGRVGPGGGAPAIIRALRGDKSDS